MVYSTIKKSQLEGAKRLDAEYYQPEYLETKKRLYSSPMLADVSERITDFGAYSQMNFVEYTEAGIRFFRNQDIGDIFISDSDPIYISQETYKKLTLKLDKYNILTPRVGTLGNAAVVFDNYLPASANQNLAQIKPDTAKIDPVYLAVFLNSKFGQFQFDQLSTGNVQPWLNLSQLKSIKVFVPDVSAQKMITNIAVNALKETEKSKSLYSQAEHLLLEELGLTHLETDEGLTWTTNLSDVKTAGRIDAEYFQPKYEKLMSKIKKHAAQPLGNLVSMKKGFEPGSEQYEGQGKLFVRVSNITKTGLVDGNQKYISGDLYGKLKKDYEPKVGEILLTKDATPGVAYVAKEPIEGIVAGGVLRLKLKEAIEPEYLAFCINSVAGQMQVERDAGGSVIAHWKPDQVKALQIPILPKPIQQKIAELVRQSHEARKKSKELLEEAKHKVETLIESQGK